MIAAEILTAPRSLDAPAAAQAAVVTAARPAEGAGFADVLAAAAAQTLPVAEGTAQGGDAVITPDLAAVDATPTIAAALTASPAPSAQVVLAMATLAPASATPPSVPKLDVPTPGLVTAGTETDTPAQAEPVVVARLTVAAPEMAESIDLPTPDTLPKGDAAPASLAAPKTAPHAPMQAGALAPETAEPAPQGQDTSASETSGQKTPVQAAADPGAPASVTPDALEAERVTPEPVKDPETADTPQTDTTPPRAAPTAMNETATDTDTQAEATAPTDDAEDGQADVLDAKTDQPQPPAAAQPVTLPPLAALIQPLIAPQTGPKGDTEETTQGDVSGSTPRKSGMSGRLALLAGADTPVEETDSTTRFADRLTPAPGQAPQDSLPQPRDAAQNPAAPYDAAQTDTAEQIGGAAPTTAQPLSADTRVTTAPTPTPQRLPEAGHLDTTQSGWEAALTERITARNTDLGQEIEITLSPENLGHIRIKLDLSDKAATVQIVTDTPQAAQLFQQSEARLADALSRAGLSLTSHDASSRDLGGRDGGQGGQRQSQTPGNPRAEAALAGLRGTLSAPVQTGRAANLVNIVA